MKKTLLLILLIFTTMVSAAEDIIELPFTQDSSKYWQYISDQTMGGVSNGKAILEKDGNIYFARLIGNVSTDNNGGFIQFRSTLPFVNIADDNKENVNCVRGNLLEIIYQGGVSTFRVGIADKNVEPLVISQLNDAQQTKAKYRIGSNVKVCWRVDAATLISVH